MSRGAAGEKRGGITGIFDSRYSIISAVLAVIVVVILLFSITYTLDEGEGAVLTQFGKIYDQTSEAGVHFKRPWANVIFWRTRLKSVNQKIEARTSDDMRVTIELTFYWATVANKLDKLYSKIAKDYETLERGFVIPGIRSAIRDEVAKVTYRELNTNREKYATLISSYAAKHLEKKFVVIDNIDIRNVVPPPKVNEAIENRIKMEQKAEEAIHKLELAKKEAEIKRVEAKGIADAQEIIQRRLTPIYVQWYAVEMMKDLAKSPNTTFIFAPTGMKGVGLPVIYGSQMTK